MGNPGTNKAYREPRPNNVLEADTALQTRIIERYEKSRENMNELLSRNIWSPGRGRDLLNLPLISVLEEKSI